MFDDVSAVALAQTCIFSLGLALNLVCGSI